jgi:hypothetical protein
MLLVALLAVPAVAGERPELRDHLPRGEQHPAETTPELGDYRDAIWFHISIPKDGGGDWELDIVPIGSKQCVYDMDSVNGFKVKPGTEGYAPVFFTVDNTFTFPDGKCAVNATRLTYDFRAHRGGDERELVADYEKLAGKTSHVTCHARDGSCRVVTGGMWDAVFWDW